MGCSESENPDLFWALRGGGGNFGVVTEFELRLHRLASVLLGEGLCPEPNVHRLLQFWREFMADAPSDLKWNIDLRLASHAKDVPVELRGQPVASSSVLWTGDPERGHPCLERALSLCNRDSVHTKVMSYLELQTMADLSFPHGRRYYTKSGYFADLDDATIDCLMAAVSEIPSPETQIELAYLGAAAAEVSATETAFGDRSAPIILNLIANWAEPTLDAPNMAWVRRLFHRLRPSMKPGVYVNFMSADEQDRVPEAYHERWKRIVNVKSHYDPTNFFRLNQNISPKYSRENLPSPFSVLDR